MHPFFSSTRASMISWPTTNCRCSSGLRSSSGTVCQGMYCSATPGLAAAGDFVTERDGDFDFDSVFSFDLAMSIACWDYFLRPAGLGQLSIVLPRLAPWAAFYAASRLTCHSLQWTRPPYKLTAVSCR